MDSIKDKNANLNFKLIIILIIVVWLATFIATLLLNKTEKTGQIGDTFGLLNALFSGLAFAVLIYTVLLQRKDLELQREELQLTRKEFSKSAIAQSNNVRIQLLMSKLNAYNAILNYNAGLIQTANPGTRDTVTMEDSKDIRKVIELILKEIDSFNFD